MIEYVWCRLYSHVFRASSKFPSRARMASALKAAETWQQTLSRLHYLCQRRNTANIIYIIIYMYVSTYMHIYIHIYTCILYIYIHSGIKWQQYLRACSQRWGERAEQQRPNLEAPGMHATHRQPSLCLSQFEFDRVDTGSWWKLLAVLQVTGTAIGGGFLALPYTTAPSGFALWPHNCTQVT